MRWRRSPGRPITSPRAEPGTRRTRPLPHPSPWSWRSAARPRHLGAGPGGGAYANMFMLKLVFASPGSRKKCSPGPQACKGLQLRGRGLASCTPLLGMFIAIAPGDRRRESPWEAPLPGTPGATGQETKRCKFPSLTLHRRNRSLGIGGCSRVESEKAGPRIDKTIWEKCMRALHVRRSGRARSTT